MSNSCNTMLCSPPGSSVHENFQARILEGVSISFSRGSSPPRNQTLVTIPNDKDDLDGLNYLTGKSLNYVNQKAFEGTLSAHEETGGVPCNVIYIEKLNAKSLGYMYYFFMRACAMSADLLDINPFNQPGVEVYKKNMFHLLGKKGY